MQQAMRVEVESVTLNLMLTRLGTTLLFLGSGAACSTPTPVNETHRGQLEAGDSLHTTDQSYYDEYTVSVGRYYHLKITLESSDFDPFLHVHAPDSQGYQDHDSGENGGALIDIAQVDRPGVWRIWANSEYPGESGTYTLTVLTEKPAPAPEPEEEEEAEEEEEPEGESHH